MESTNHNTSRNSYFVKILTIILIVFSMVISKIYIFNPFIDAAEPAPTDPTTVELNLRNTLQNAFDKMLTSATFTTYGIAAAKKILKTDAKGNIVIVNNTFELRPEIQDIFNQQLMKMSAGNYNAYTRLAMSGWSLGASISVGEPVNGVIKEVGELELIYDITWHDGTNALAARMAVESHVSAFLNSNEYKSKTTDYDRLKSINNFLFRTFQYDYRVFDENESENAIYTAYQMIMDKGSDIINGYPRGVCQAYAMYGYIMLKKAGYDSITIDGRAPIPPPENPDINPHVWNMIKLGSFWYHIDFTWNDPISGDNPAPYVYRQADKENDENSENFLLRSDDEISINHIWQPVQDGFIYYIAAKKWNGTPEIINITQPPAPTLSPTPTQAKSNYATATSQWEVRNPAVTTVNSSKSLSKQTDANLKSVKISSISVNADNTNSTANGIAKTANKNDSQLIVNISGIITDEKGNPIINKTVELYSTSKTTQTANNGFYEFKGILPGSYKIYIKDINGTEIAQLPVVISLGENTEQLSGTVYVKGENLVMDLMLTGNVLSIKNISSPSFQLSLTMIIVTAIIIIGVLISLSILLFKKKQDDLNWDYLN